MSSIAVNPIARPTQRPRLRVVRDHERAVPARRVPAGTTDGRAVSARPVAAPAPARLTRRGRLVVALVFLGAVLLAAVAFGARSAATGDAGSPVPTRMVQVGPGDTLWGIASQVAGPGQVRERVLQIEELNALSGPALRVGQRLAVPVR
jgi:LysM repeat protein